VIPILAEHIYKWRTIIQPCQKDEWWKINSNETIMMTKELISDKNDNELLIRRKLFMVKFKSKRNVA